MGTPKKKRKKYEKPKKLWDRKRIDEEKELREEFGLKNAKELWKAATSLRKIRREARRLLSLKGAGVEKRTKQLLDRVKKFLINKPEITLDDVLRLTTRDILARRLQTIVHKKHFSKTAKQARQFITHGHLQVNGRKVAAPSYLVKFDEEDSVNWYKHAVQTVPKPKAAGEETPEKKEEAAPEGAAEEKKEEAVSKAEKKKKTAPAEAAKEEEKSEKE